MSSLTLEQLAAEYDSSRRSMKRFFGAESVKPKQATARIAKGRENGGIVLMTKGVAFAEADERDTGFPLSSVRMSASLAT